MKPILLCLLLTLFGVTPLTTTGNPDQSAPARVILDTDIGDDIDDAWALAFILAHKNFDLLGVTIAHGNTPARAPIAAKMLRITRRDSVPVAVGRKTSDGYSHQYTWAEDFTAKRPIKVAVFGLSGLLAACAAVLQCARLSSADPNAGAGAELQAIAACVIGGASLSGGRGSAVNTFFGVLIIAVLGAGLAQIGAQEPTRRFVTGCVILAAVILDMYRAICNSVRKFALNFRGFQISVRVHRTRMTLIERIDAEIFWLYPR